MKKLLLLLLLLPGIANAATIVCADEKDPSTCVSKFMDTWSYTYNVKTGSLSVSTPLQVTELDCATPATPSGKLLLGKPTKCYGNETEARKAAQAEADKFEQDKIKNGESSTMIEAKRQFYKAKSKLTQ